MNQPGKSSSFASSASALLGLAAVACGAFGAHALKKHYSPEDLEIWKTGALYHLVHAVLLVWLTHRIAARGAESRPGLLTAAAWAFTIGIVLFSGSLYALVLTQHQPWLGPITPLGGLSLMAGWLLLALAPGKAGRK